MKQERQKTKTFLKRCIRLRGSYMAEWFAAGMCSVIMVIISIFPQQQIWTEDRFVLALLALFGPCIGIMYLAPYRRYSDGVKRYNMMEQIRYLPIRYEVIRQLHVYSLVKIYGWITVVSLATQLLFVIPMGESVSWLNIAYILGTYLVLPLSVNLLMVHFMDR